ncbi:MAG: hypothetical protein IJP12_02725 [Methanobrevibacter sp.]|nr:hypothetical protein [Methanobrevibacter sp.]
MDSNNDSNDNKDDLKAFSAILKILEGHSVELRDDIKLYIRDDENLMKKESVDGVFVPEIPFNVSIKEDIRSELPYLNIILMEKGKRMLYVGDGGHEDFFDTIIAPETEFEIVEEVNEFTTVWKCGAQPFYDK